MATIPTEITTKNKGTTMATFWICPSSGISSIVSHLTSVGIDESAVVGASLDPTDGGTLDSKHGMVMGFSVGEGTISVSFRLSAVGEISKGRMASVVGVAVGDPSESSLVGKTTVGVCSATQPIVGTKDGASDGTSEDLESTTVG